jgi:hypothetical protein
MKKTHEFIYAILVCGMGITLLGCSPDMQNTYYISPDGNDENSGLSAQEAWASLDRVNRDTFLAGDAILFECGGTWKGQLRPQGNGEPDLPITLGSYGSGPRPVINIGRAAGVAIHLVNQSWWEIGGIEITSGARPELGKRRGGIVATLEGDGVHMEHIVIRDCHIHDVWGQVGGKHTGIAIYVGPLIYGGQRSEDWTVTDVLVEDNRIERVDKVGIVVSGQEEVIVRGNYMENLGGDGIIVFNANEGLIERNIANRTCLRSGDPDLETGGEDWWPHTAAIWIARCTGTVMQYNEVYNTGRQLRNGDGFAYDFDFECRNCVLQYNYSANGHGLLLIMNRTYDNIARYNISQNDQTHLIQIHGNTEDGNLIHNNIFYVDHSTVDLDYYCGMENEKETAKMGVTFRNNIFYAGGQGRFRSVYTHGSAWERQFNDTIKFSASEGGPLFENNCFYGTWLNGIPEDENKIVADPMFILPGSGAKGLPTLGGYQLKPGSPCIDAGIAIDMDRQQDFFGNPVTDEAMDIGVYEYGNGPAGM